MQVFNSRRKEEVTVEQGRWAFYLKSQIEGGYNKWKWARPWPIDLIHYLKKTTRTVFSSSQGLQIGTLAQNKFNIVLHANFLSLFL